MLKNTAEGEDNGLASLSAGKPQLQHREAFTLHLS
jgi:hypothetical protein